jgi:hypothetical protein
MTDIEIKLSDTKTVNPHFVSEGELRRALIAAYKYRYDTTAYDNKNILDSGLTLDGNKYPWYMRLHADLLGFIAEFYRSHYGYYKDLIDLSPFAMVQSFVQPYVKDKKWHIASDDFLRAFMTSHYWQSNFSLGEAMKIKGGKPRNLGEMLKTGGGDDITKTLMGMPTLALNKISRLTMMPQKKLSLPEFHAAILGQQKVDSRIEKLLKSISGMSEPQMDSSMKKLYERIMFYRDPFDYAFKKFGKDAPSVLLSCHVMDKLTKGKPIHAMERIAQDLFSTMDKVIDNLKGTQTKEAIYKSILGNKDHILGVAGYVERVLSSTDRKEGVNFEENLKNYLKAKRIVAGGKKKIRNGSRPGGKKKKIIKRSH